MSARTNEDVSIVSQTMPTGLEGVRAIEKFLKDSTSEVKKLLYDECDVLLECRFCRNIFRSVINYVAHKRVYCKVSHVQVTHANSAATSSQDSSADFLGRQPLPATKKKGNIMNSLNKRLETEVVPISKSPELLTLHTLPRISKELPITTFEDGKQKIVGALPANLACKEALRPDRTMLAMPQDNSSRYREMQLRSRREHTSNAAPPAREISAVEGTMVDRYERYLRQTADFAECKCLQSSCSNLKPFGSVSALAYHATVHHICNEYFKAEQAKTDEERETLAITLPCIVCGRPMRSVSGVDEHMRRYHTNVREEHRKYREDEAAEERKKKKPFSGKRDEDSRSMSPVRCEETEIKKELDEEGEEEQTKQKPRRGRRPAFRPVNEAGLEEEEDEEEEDEERENSDEREKEEEPGGGGGGAKRKWWLKGVRAMLEARKAKKRSRGADGRAEPNVERASSGGSSNSSDDKEGEANKESHEKSEDSLLTSPPLLSRHGSGATSSNNSILKSPSPRKGESKRYEESVDDDLIVGLCVDYLVKEACRMAGEVEKRRPGRPPKKRPLESFMEATSKLAQEESSRSLPRPGRGRGAKRHISHRHSMPASGSSTAVPTKRERRSGEKEKEKERRSKEHEEEREQKEEEKEEEHHEEKREQREEKGGGDSEDETMSEKGGVSRPARVRRRPGWMESYEMKSAGNEMDTSMDSKQDILTRALESALGNSPPPRTAAASNDDFVLPPQSDSAPSSQSPSPKKKRPIGWKSRNEDSSQRSKNLLKTPKKKGKGYPSDEDSAISDFLYTPVAGRLLKEKRKGAEVEDGDCSRDSSEEDPSISSRRRKQNLGQVADDSDDFQIVQVGDGRNIQRRSDLASVPVYLSETQQRLFFTGLKTVPAQKTGGSGKETFECSYCHTTMANIRDGRRHMVSHLRVMRLRCALCSAGSFFCIDMRNHLQQRGCPNLHLAPNHLVAPGTVTPCMSKQDADNLTYIAHPMSPGRTLFTSGKIVSITSHKPYLPDPVIEEQMLGPARVPPRLLSSPRKVPLKLIKSTAAAANAALFQDHRQPGVQNLGKVLVNCGDDESPTYYEDVDDAALSVVSSADQGGGPSVDPSEGAPHSSTPSAAGARSTLASTHHAAAHAEDTAESGARRTGASMTGSSASSAMLHAASDAVKARTAAPTGKSKSYTKRASTVEEARKGSNGTTTAKPPMLVAKAASAGREAGPATTTKRASSQGDERGARLSQSASSSGQQQQQQMQHIRLMTATGDINVSRSRPTPTPTPPPAEPSPQPPTSGTPMVM